jgi:hypothetical protein
VCEEHKKVAVFWKVFELVRLDLHDASLLLHQEEFSAYPGREVIACVFLSSTTIKSILNSFGIVIR